MTIVGLPVGGYDYGAADTNDEYFKKHPEYAKSRKLREVLHAARVREMTNTFILAGKRKGKVDWLIKLKSI
jgi:hypothetical protein